MYQMTTKLPKGHNIFQMGLGYSKLPKNIPTFPMPRKSIIYPNWYFGTKIYHLATLLETGLSKSSMDFSGCHISPVTAASAEKLTFGREHNACTKAPDRH
jgi:hypothetical protein